MARTSLRQKTETLVVVTVITALVWLYAEGRNVTEYTNVPIEIVFVAASDGGEGELTIIPDKPQRVLITFEGSTATKQALDNLAAQGPIQIPIAESPDGIRSTPVVVIRELNKSALSDLHIQVTAVDREEILVTARRFVTVDMPIEVEVTGVELMSPPTVEPSRVAVRMPSTLEGLAGTLDLKVALTAEQLAGVEAGVPRAVQGRIELPEELRATGVKPAVDTASVSVVILKQTASVTLPAVPIHINLPPLLLDRYKIRLPDDQQVLRDIKLSGPTDQINDIGEKRYKVWAEVRPTADELEDPQFTSAQLFLHIPPGVRVDSPLPRVPVIVERRP